MIQSFIQFYFLASDDMICCVLVLKTKQNTKNCLRAVYYYHTNMCILTHHTYMQNIAISFFSHSHHGMAHDMLNSSAEVIEGSEKTHNDEEEII